MSEQNSNIIQVNISCTDGEYSTIIRDFSNYLKKRGHSDGTQHDYYAALSHFVRWLTKEKLHWRKINSETVNVFLQQHLPECHCPPPVIKTYKTLRAALNQLLLMLGEERLSAITSKIPPPIENILREFDNFQREVCGFAESTRIYRQRFVRTFLVWLFGTSRVDSSKITPEILVRFVIDQAGDLKPSSVGVLLSALRSYLRFLQYKGESNISLLASVPRPPNWSLVSLPPGLTNAEIEKFFATFDQSTPVGKRDYAMARCLMDLGLRCHEVASLKLGDIHWHEGIVDLHHNKSRREAQLPLPDRTGRAIVDYLRNGRPATTCRSIFVFHRAPFGCGVANTTVRGAIRRAFSRAGLSWTGTHILRHTIATKMVQSGATLKEVADVLRHRDIDTTRIYTKVNLPELKQVAMPWPGRQP
jgi:site-specific recombinase XerD